ncbi:MAG: hypothetical protein WA416_14085 [Candidatus Sulfotelmatobacter sp.]
MAMLFHEVPSRKSESKRNGIENMVKILSLAFLLVVPALAQNQMQAGPPATAYGPTYDVSCGYSYLSSTIPSAGRVGLSGLDVTGHANFLPHWGVAVDSGYVRTSNVLTTGQSGYTLTFLAGPVFHLFEQRKTQVFVHALAGAGLVDSAVPVSGSEYLQGWVARPAYAVGSGIERTVAGPFAVRLTGDYLRTSYADSAGAVSAQNNLRLTASIVFRLRERQGIAP